MQPLGADEWRAALRNRGHKVSIHGHPAAVRRLVQSPETVAAGPHEASVHGLDLVALSAHPEVYLDDHAWAKLAEVLNLDIAAPSSASALVRLVHGDGIVDRLRANERLLGLAVAADCLDDADPRANYAGLEFIKEAVDRTIGPRA